MAVHALCKRDGSNLVAFTVVQPVPGIPAPTTFTIQPETTNQKMEVTQVIVALEGSNAQDMVHCFYG